MRSAKILLLLLICLSFLMGKTSYAQSYTFKSITTADGLTDDNITFVYPHENGQVYIGTGSGLDVFDGINIFKIKTGNVQGIISIFPYGKDSLILIKQNGVAVINIQNYNYRLIDYSDTVRNVMNAAVMVGDYIYCSSEDGFVQLKIPEFRYKNLTKNMVSKDSERFSTGLPSICYSPYSKRIYMGHRHGLLMYDISTQKFIGQDANSSKFQCLTSLNLKATRLIYNNEKIYFIVNSSLKYYDEKNDSVRVDFHKSITHIQDLNETIITGYKSVFNLRNNEFKIIDSLQFENSLAINYIAKSKNETYFFCTKSGLILAQKSSTFIKETAYNEEAKISSPELQYLYTFKNKQYLNFKQGMMVLDTNTSKFELIKLPEESNIKRIFSGFYYQKNIICLVGIGGYIGFDLSSEKYVPLRFFSDSLEAEIKTLRITCGNFDSLKNHIVFCPYRNPIIVKDGAKEYRWNGNNLDWFRTVRSLIYLGNYNYIFGANGSDGVMKYNFKTKHGRYYSANSFAKAGVSAPIINKMCFRGDKLLLASANGLIELDTASGNITKFLYEENEFNEQVYNISKINNDYFVTTRYGISLLTENKMYELHHFNNIAATGFPFLLNHKICFFNNQNFVELDYLELPPIVSVFISHIGVNEKIINLLGKNEINLNYTSNEIRLFWGHLNTDFNKPIRIFYKFKNQIEWKQLTGSILSLEFNGYGKREIEYYTMQLGRKGDVKIFVINIQKPWWASYWFYAFFALSFLGIIFIIFRWNNHRNIETKRKELALVLSSIEKERARIGSDFHDAIGPNLSSIKLIGELLKNTYKDSKSNQMSELIDQTIFDIRHVINELSPSILKSQGLSIAIETFIVGFDASYPNINMIFEEKTHQKRFKEDIEINLYRICQEAVNNALKYAKCDEILIELESNQEEIKLAIIDNGIGIPEINTKGHGIQNIKSRAEILKGSTEIKNENGTTIIISIPLGG